MKSIKKYVIPGVIIAMLSCTVAFGANINSVVNEFNTGIVDIELTDSELDKDEDTINSGSEDYLLPGELVSWTPRIYNKEFDCYVRAKVDFSDTSLSNNNLTGVTTDWVKKSDGYMYYTKVLKSGESVDIFNGVQVPADFNLPFGTEVGISVSVDAIQSRNFTANFDMGNPWGNVVIKAAKENKGVTEFKSSDNNVFSVVWDGNTKDLVINSEDFFSDFATMMPGDVLEHEIKLKSTTDPAPDLYFNTESIDDSDILSKIGLEIKVGGKVIYSGNLKSEQLENKIKLGSYKDGSMTFKVTVPSELDNDYSLESSKVKWVFSVEEKSTTNNNNGGSSSGEKNPDNVKTNDTTRLGLNIIILIVSGSLTALIIKKGKRKF